ncbi:DBH-like monooxygenase protein 1 [Tubulanus polymorphus]|uniref:DBH-like monooxygenase protein 1 n=1 Tax=Tubulanus polymorphus TaxID=672921 RepID=UPI003DA6B785
MPGSDVVVGWMDSNTTKARLVDAHLTGRSQPIEDAMSDWKLLNASSTNGRMNFTFERCLDTGDDAHDMIIKPGVVHIIWAYSKMKIPSLRYTAYHGYSTRGSRQLELYKATQVDNATTRSPTPEPSPTQTTTRHALDTSTACSTTTMPGPFLPAPRHFSRKAFLDPAKKYLLEWQYDGPPSTVITFRVTVKTTGYVGFGLSRNGAMKDADIVVGWVTRGSADLRDMHGVGNAMPVPDAYENWTLKVGYEKDGYTQLTFYRQLDTCDKDGDLRIESGAQRIIYAYNDEDPTDPDTIKYHKSNRGALTLYLLDKPEPTFTPGPDFKSFEFRMPAIEQKVQPGNELYVHHMLVKECRKGRLNDSVLSVHGNKKSPRVLRALNECWTTTAVFAVGADAIVFPRDAGVSIGGASDSVYYRLEIHYDNPHRKSGTYDTSGVRFTYTSKLRKYDVGVMTAGTDFGEPLSKVIPPRQEKFKYRGFCSRECLEMAFKEYTGDEKEIKIFSVFGHAHLAGAGIRTRHFRDGLELPWIHDDMSYDFNYQIWRPLREPVIVKPGDTIMAECTFNTEDRENVTYAGEATTSEMCYSFVSYYPKIPLTYCQATANTTGPASEVWSDKFKESIHFQCRDPPKTNICYEANRYLYQKMLVIKSLDLQVQGTVRTFYFRGRGRV